MTIASEAQAARRRASPGDYFALMRLDHATKHVFILPGIAIALLLRGDAATSSPWAVAAGFGAAVLIASANYVINEWLDRRFDAHHPTKRERAAVRLEMSRTWVMLLWVALCVGGLALALSANTTLFMVCAAFAAQGIVYNVRPLRLKDVAYVDVLVEAVNNPLRLMIGWAMVDKTTLPPGSLLIGYWIGGAFLMAAKRLSEYREVAGEYGADRLALYRASFAGYSEQSLLVSCFVYALTSAMTLAIFFVKYRIEYILMLPAIALLFGQYLAMALSADSTAQRPERLFQERGLMMLVVLVVGLFAVCTLVKIPALAPLTMQYFIKLP
ncbi:UbiA family prenyltransferase [Phenylobacterium montanum]|uniref:UbiA family prenyltransferase n=1 Tax=Phenylobacterium montanum TaxID=2823693 RepID=A0A975G2F5_9CAUL|nr:UbiA family prenyltransferase [Caulobacter sp. S6]